MTPRPAAWLGGCSAALALAACAAAVPNASGAPAQPAIPAREAVVRVGAFSVVRALAVASNRAFLVGDGGVAIYDRLRRSWTPPISLEAPRALAPGSRTLAATNLIGDVAWVAGEGRVVVVNAGMRATFATPYIGAARTIRVDRGGANAYVLADQWWEVSTAGSARPISAAELPPRERLADPADASDPAVRRAIDDPLLTRDAALRSWPVLAAARGATSSDVWLGTAGGGVFHVDPDFHRSEQLPFGLQTGYVVALARTADGVVIAEGVPARLGAGVQSAITEGSDDLARWRWAAISAQVGDVRAIAMRGRSLCVAGMNGAGMLELPRDDAGALPATTVHVEPTPAAAVAVSRDGCVVGTQSSVTVIPWPDEGGAPRELRRSEQLPPVNAVASAGDTTWAGTRDGLVVLVGGHVARVERPFPASSEIVALALVADGVAAASASEVAVVGSGTVRRLAIPLAGVGRITALAADGRTLWIGGTTGVVATVLASGASAPVSLDAPGDPSSEPAGGHEVHALVLGAGVAWIGTAAGLVRVRRDADGLPR